MLYNKKSILSDYENILLKKDNKLIKYSAINENKSNKLSKFYYIFKDNKNNNIFLFSNNNYVYKYNYNNNKYILHDNIQNDIILDFYTFISYIKENKTYYSLLSNKKYRKIDFCA